MIRGSYKLTEGKVRRLPGQNTRAEKTRERIPNTRGLRQSPTLWPRLAWNSWHTNSINLPNARIPGANATHLQVSIIQLSSD